MHTDTKEQFLLPPGDVCSIIEACGKADVQVLRYGNLYLRRGPGPKNKLCDEYPLLAPDAPADSTPDHVQQNSDALKFDEEELRSEQLRMLMIENPMEYERQLRDGELDDEPEHADDGEA